LQLEVFQGTRFCTWSSTYWHHTCWCACWRKELRQYQETRLTSHNQTTLVNLGLFVIKPYVNMSGVNLSSIFQQLEKSTDLLTDILSDNKLASLH